eukprot:gnl/TRDRNA2_/TRDRNA2_90781_c0_seq1.p1 gnl/TRDRNA2_/TRDRNA2_90781_c0~~gnl/TRDRNA2_/TRDRNA2_90781_c0_seq1.p1  ORF type:complete len:143 (+),score=22.14 gnl/TRDRNA2_/TRDRNA2_90781_c0_seq1:65-493(+)
MADAEEGPVGPLIDVTAIEISPEGECTFEEELGLAISFSTDTPLMGYCWMVRYVVDTSKKRKIVDLGATELADYMPGAHAMVFSCPRIDVSGVPDDVLSQRNGMLMAVLTGPAGEEAMAVNMVVQVTARDGILCRMVFNPME